MTIFSYILLVLFVITVVVVYLTVRRGQVNTVQGLLYGGAVMVIVISLFSLSTGLEFLRSVLTGVGFGVIFNTITTTAAAFFLKNDVRTKQTE